MSNIVLSSHLLNLIDLIGAVNLDEQDLTDRLNEINKDLRSLEKQNRVLEDKTTALKAEIDDLNYRAEEDERTIINHEKEMDRISDLLREACKKLSELTHGLPIEKAKECGDYYCLDLGYCVATYFENGKWYYSDDGPNRNPCEVSNRLYPLPSTETQMEGE